MVVMVVVRQVGKYNSAYNSVLKLLIAHEELIHHLSEEAMLTAL